MTDDRERLAAWCEERAQWIMSRDDAAKCKDIAALLREPVNARLLEALQEYGAHEPSCLMAQWHEGRPTKDGGYETRYGDVWYPRGEQPPCSCGLMDAIAALDAPGVVKWHHIGCVSERLEAPSQGPSRAELAEALRYVLGRWNSYDKVSLPNGSPMSITFPAAEAVLSRYDATKGGPT